MNEKFSNITNSHSIYFRSDATSQRFRPARCPLESDQLTFDLSQPSQSKQKHAPCTAECQIQFSVNTFNSSFKHINLAFGFTVEEAPE